ncbi:MAG: glycosyltransferase family 2 protein [Betaproteobacteria bacterium]
MNTRRPLATEAPVDDVTVLLSTFNGEDFLQAQLDSLYAQTHAPARILVRDDGSSDGTAEILEKARAAGRIEILASGPNLGAARSFLELLRLAVADSAGYIAFCDQDDIWSPDKIARAVAVLSSSTVEAPVMYCSRLALVDADLNPLGLTPLPGKTGFGNALVENIAVGCTIMLNRAASELVATNLPARVLIHDWWCYAVVSCFGSVLYDEQPTIQYRQHGSNAFGADAAGSHAWARKLRRFSGRGPGLHWQSDQAITFLETFRDRMPVAPRRLVEKFTGARSAFRQRLSLAMSGKVWRQKPLDDFAQRMLILLNRY